jgi:predicted nucleic acid-binding protein
VRLVIADTSPINYLLLIGHIDILPALFSKVILPAVVRDELRHPKAPLLVRDWIARPPEWVELRQTPANYVRDRALAGLDAGEEDAIALALELRADLLVMDDEEGVTAARAKGLEVTGTLGILNRATQRRLSIWPTLSNGSNLRIFGTGQTPWRLCSRNGNAVSK